uniref:T9SS type A sorting domain-containing protein n=1 Tax=Polaribacter sp. TaxID=1920175 RepID=UPI003F6C1175
IGKDRGFADRVINGSIAEVMFFSDAHSDTKRQQVQSYLAIKYGFTLDDTDNSVSIVEGDYVLAGGSPKVWNYTNNSTFHNDVAGIGRDDAMALNQKQSKSVSSDAIITIGLDAISATNALNTNTFTTNKDFLMWGNNNGVINSITETELICAPEKTIGRTWKIKETGSVGLTQVAVNRATIDAALVTPNTVKVFKVADDAAFTTNVAYMPLTAETINSENVYTVDYNFNGTKYFTYSEINGIFWNGDMNAWVGGNSGTVSGGPSINAADRDKVMVIDAQTSLTNAVLTENVRVECVWIKENSKLMVADDRYLEFDEDFILDGEMRLMGDGQLVQTHIGLSNVEGSGKLYRDQQAVVPNVYRYHYWSSPVRELNKNTFRVAEVMKDGNIPTSENSTITDINFTSLDQSGVDNRGLNGAPGVAGITPISISNFWIYTNINDPAANDEQSGNYFRRFETGAINRANGYTMKTTGVVGQNFTFVGTPNDGTITIPLTGETASLVGNPYPSALDATDFINTNIDVIDGTLYFWEHTGEDEEPSGISGHTFAGYYGGYGQRNLTMGIAADGVGSIEEYTFDWTTATEALGVVSETVKGVTVDMEFSNGEASLLPNLLNLGGTLGNIVGKIALTTSEYDVTVNFSESIDLKTIYLYNNVVLPLTNPTITITPDNGTPVTQTLSGITGQEITLNWDDVTSFTITTDNPYNLVIDNLNFFKTGVFPSLGDAIYTAPKRYIAVGQGFFVRADANGGTLRFENSQRNYSSEDGSESYFFKSNKAKKTKQEEELDLLPVLKLGFNRTSSDAVELHRQIGISFRRGNTFKYENGYDSDIFDVGDNDIYWQFPELEGRKLVIAGVEEISNNLEVPLTIAVNNGAKKSLQIDELKNVNTPIYLLDKLTDTYYTLSETPLELDIPNGKYTDRFYITFAKKTSLSVDDLNPLSKDLTVFMDNDSDEIVIQNNKLVKIKKVALFNILGQEIKSWKNIDKLTENRIKTNKLSKSVYIINVETESGKLSKKVVVE